MTASQTCVPDLLQRFVPTPHSDSVVIRGTEIAIETNDSDLLAAVQRAGTNNPITQHKPLFMKVVRDHDAPHSGSEITVIEASPITTVHIGTGSMLALDGERREILGFLAASISPDEFVDQLLAILLDHLHALDGSAVPGEAASAL